MKKKTLAFATFVLAMAATVFASQNSPRPAVAHEWPFPECPIDCHPSR